MQTKDTVSVGYKEGGIVSICLVAICLVAIC